MFCRTTKIYELIRTLGVVKHKKRQEFLVDIIQGVIKSRSVLFSEIADKIDKPILTSSIERRIQDFFKEVSFDYKQLLFFLLCFVHHDQLSLSIDRTEWDFGKLSVNVLCVVVSIGKMGVPIYFEMLDNNSGNSNYNDRIALFKDIIESVGLDRISIVLMDREFIGCNWLSWLKQKGILFCVRVPKHHKITLADGTRMTAVELLEENDNYPVSLEDVCVDTVSLNVKLWYNQQGELFYLIGTIPVGNLAKAYKKRWTIEVIFQAFKGRGFNMEDSCLRCLKKYKKLFAIVSMAYTLCWATGIQEGKIKPVKKKKHGYPQYSVFRRGLNLIRDFLKGRVCQALEQALDKAKERIILFNLQI